MRQVRLIRPAPFAARGGLRHLWCRGDLRNKHHQLRRRLCHGLRCMIPNARAICTVSKTMLRREELLHVLTPARHSRVQGILRKASAEVPALSFMRQQLLPQPAARVIKRRTGVAGTAVVLGRGGRQAAPFLLPAPRCGRFSCPVDFWLMDLRSHHTKAKIGASHFVNRCMPAIPELGITRAARAVGSTM